MTRFEQELRGRLDRSIELSESQAVAKAVLDHPTFENIEFGRHVDDYAAVAFLDIRGFTRLSMALPTEETARLLTAVLGATVSVLRDFDAHINDFTGDGIMAVFSREALGSADAVHTRTLHAASNLMTDMHATLREDLLQAGIDDPVQVALGIYSGDVRWQHVGTRECSRLGVVGQVAPLASKLVSGEFARAWETMIGGAIANSVPEDLKSEQPKFVRQYGDREMTRRRWVLDTEGFWREALGGPGVSSVIARATPAASLLGIAPATSRRGDGGRKDSGVA